MQETSRPRSAAVPRAEPEPTFWRLIRRAVATTLMWWAAVADPATTIEMSRTIVREIATWEAER